MTEFNDRTRQHYQANVSNQNELLAKISAIVDGMGSGPLTAAKLSGVDQFHVGGLTATVEFAKRIGISADTTVLDAGSGLGGPSRFLAETLGCHVEGVDLTPAYVAVADMLTKRAGLAEKVRSQVGDLTKLPFDDATFDLVWTQHVVMNIPDRGAVYHEFRRVLKPNGRLAFYDVLASDGKPVPHYPTPWAETAAMSTLLTEDETRSELGAAGFAVAKWDDVTKDAFGWMNQQPPPAPGAIGPGLIVGPRIGEMVGNFRRNLEEGRVRLVMSVCEAVR